MEFASWDIKGFDRASAAKLYRSGINPLVSVLLASRGMCAEDDIYRLLRTDMSEIADPFLLTDMDIAVERINRAIDSGERIAVFGDYDVDGMTSSCLMASYFRSRGVECDIYIPGRFAEGYGVSSNAVELLHEKGVTLIVTVDCGITAHREVEYAAGLGIDIVITDHHECSETLPDALAVINPKRPDCPYPNKALAGVGVAFKLVCALDGGNIDTLLETYSDLVAIGTVADVMSVLGENRVLIRRGLTVLNKRRRPGLRLLMREAGLEGRELNSASIGFNLAPRLNAAGRMGRTSLSVELLLTEDENEAENLAHELSELNMNRRALESEIFDDAVAQLSLTGERPIVLAKKGWYQGVMGIVASRLAEKYFIPTIMICIGDDGLGRGSCRSFGEYNIYNALTRCSDLLENYGGHEMAAGLTIPEHNIEAFKERFCKYYHEKVLISPAPMLKIEFEAKKPGLFSMENVTALKQLEPYGNGNIPPSACIMGAQLRTLTGVGGGRHSKIRVSKWGEIFDVICFSKSPKELGVTQGSCVDLAFEPQINEFRGRKSVQLLLLDIRKHME